MSNFNIQST